LKFSVHQLLDSDFASDAARLFWRRGIDPGRLALEITESFAACSERARQQIAQLKEIGVRLAIDDFGTGYSSLSSLRDCPFDIVKIDRSFVPGVTCDVRDQQLTHSIIELGHLFGAEVNAEGVEEREQLTVLGALGCGFGQGYYFARPLDAQQFNAFLHGRARSVRRTVEAARQLVAGIPATSFEHASRTDHCVSLERGVAPTAHAG
jgi:EAL domain-containing protein (putative c-di-GMP-specific phosphodiesterase class I)